MILRKFALQQMYIWLVVLVIVIIASFSLLIREKSNSPGRLGAYPDSAFLAPGKEWKSPLKVEDYFIEHEHMTMADALRVRNYAGSDGKITFRLLKTATLESLSSDLEKYGFVRSKEALMYALDNTSDNLPGRTDAIKIGDNTVDKYASYRISENMTAWEIADQILNHPNYFAYDETGYLFTP